MSDSNEGQDLATSLSRTATAVGRLAADPNLFTTLVNALRSDDATAFNDVLKRLRITPLCEEICRWVCSKECVLLCLQFCGPPKVDITAEQIPQFAQAVARITSDPKLTERLAAIVERRDANGFRAFIKDQKLDAICHLICHWVCGIHCRLACEIVCGPRLVARKQLAAELAAAGTAIARIAKDPGQLQKIIKAALALDCETLNGIFGTINDCVLICEWICSWRCLLVCLPLCRAFPPSADVSINEMRAFGQLVGRLAANPTAFPQLVAAVQAQNVQAFSALAKQFEITTFCLQFCHWICFEICRRFCFCICPEPQTIPVFTHVGNYQVDFAAGDFNTNGTTTDHGFAFTGTIDLKGVVPTPDGNAAHQIEYRFSFQDGSKGPAPNPVAGTPIAGTMVPRSVIGILEYWEWDSTLLMWVFRWHEVTVNDPLAPPFSIKQPGPPLPVVVNVNTAPDGWIQVPWYDNFVPGGEGRFVPEGLLAKLDTTKLTTEVFDLTPSVPPLPLAAGDAMPAAQKSAKPVFQINFEARKVIGAAPVGSNILNNIALSNTTYTYNRHPDWAGSPPPVTTVPVVSIDIKELKEGGGCSPIGNDIHALFTAYHPYLATCEVFLEGPAPLPPAVNPAISADGEADSPAGGQDFDTSALKPCAYILWLEVTMNLTDGYTQVGGTPEDHIAFCKE